LTGRLSDSDKEEVFSRNLVVDFIIETYGELGKVVIAKVLKEEGHSQL
tara:strand:- start:266 stop:409 length:144 start_codon:yes stop_codon:yes gene_type:complete